VDLAGAAHYLLGHYGYFAVFLLPMLESTGLPVPGETMLVTAAVYAATSGRLNIALVIAAAAAGAIIGDNIGYLIGLRGGRNLVLRYGHIFRFEERHLRAGERFFARHGDKTVFLARFVAVLRVIGAFLAGTNRMRYRKFLIYNAAGGIVWATGYGLLAYALGKQFERYQTLLARFGVGLLILTVVAFAAFWVFGRRRFERWALGEDEES
jgi:membrane protein DedA with SNARE-associated domain